MSSKAPEIKKIVAQNRKARFNFSLEESFEAGIVLQGSEVKSLRAGHASIGESYAEIRGEEVFLINSNIPEYSQASHFTHYPARPRKLLLKKKQIRKLLGKIKQHGYTLVPLSVYFNQFNKAKVELALAKGKKNFDKRETIKQRDWERNKARVLKGD
jgi:SsrA-binding protein